MDDIILFSNWSIEDIWWIKEAMDLFLKATDLSINNHKSTITMEDLSRAEVGRISEVLSFEVKAFHDIFKYLGFHLKPYSYWIQDWH